MTRIGYTLMTEQSGPKRLVEYAARAEAAGFDFEVMSDHYFPWLEEQGHSGYAWSMLGAVASVTERVELMTYVTCPTMRYHPAVVAQKAATVGVLSDGRFLLGLGAGENLNEHVVGQGWPAPPVRQDMLVEAAEIIRALLAGEDVTYDGEYFRVDAARLWDLPERRVEIAAAVSGPRGVSRFAPVADHLIAVQPEAELVEAWERSSAPNGGELSTGSRKIGQLPVSWDPDESTARRRAHREFRWFGGGWDVNAELPGPDGFAAASRFVREEDVAESIPCGPDLDRIVEAARAYVDAGFTDVALVQIGDEAQGEFLDRAVPELLPMLSALA